jgi:hypothetical protein
MTRLSPLVGDFTSAVCRALARCDDGFQVVQLLRIAVDTLLPVIGHKYVLEHQDEGWLGLEDLCSAAKNVIEEAIDCSVGLHQRQQLFFDKWFDNMADVLLSGELVAKTFNVCLH